MLSNAFYLASALFVLMLSPAPVHAAAPSAEPAAARFSVLPAKDVIKRFKLVSLLSAYARKDQDSLQQFSEIEKAIVFEGNTTLGGELDISGNVGKKNASPLEKTLLKDARLIVINGDLNCRVLNTNLIEGIFVLGNVNCEKVYLGLAHVYVQGNLTASKALLGSAEDDEGSGNVGKEWVRVNGTVSAPSVRTWYFGLGHLKFAKGSGREVIVEQEEPGSSGPCERVGHC